MTEIGGTHWRFQPTQWSVVMRAADDGASGQRDAMARLIERYWKPVYVFVRRGRDAETAKDLTQAFFASLLERGIGGVDPERGAFRNYLLGAAKHFLGDQARAAAAEKRGGGRPLLSIELDLAGAESELQAQPVDRQTPEDAFHRSWACLVIQRALAATRAEMEARATPDYARALELTLGPQPPSHAEIARLLGVGVGDVANYLKRARRVLRDQVLREVLPTVDGLRSADAEVRALLDALESA